jgi:hypothetical protein
MTTPDDQTTHRKKLAAAKQHHESGLEASLSFIAAGERRVSRQKQLVARLKGAGESTVGAEAELARFETTLSRLRNHLDIMRELMKPRFS